MEIDLPPELAGAAAPNFILQPLVENAIKHGAARSRRRTTVSVRVRAAGDSMVVTVTNRTGPDAHDGSAPVSHGRTGIGLANTRRRLETQYGASGRLEAGATPQGYTARIILPLAAASGF